MPAASSTSAEPQREDTERGMHELEAGDGENLFARSERALQTAVGLEHQLQNGIKGRVELYRRTVERPRRMYLNLWREILAFPELEGM